MFPRQLSGDIAELRSLGCLGKTKEYSQNPVADLRIVRNDDVGGTEKFLKGLDSRLNFMGLSPGPGFGTVPIGMAHASRGMNEDDAKDGQAADPQSECRWDIHKELG